MKRLNGLLIGTAAILSVTVSAPTSAACDDPPTSRYVTKGAEVYDTKTRLTWQRCSVGQRWQEGKGCVGEIKQLTLSAAKYQASGGWRVPTKEELITLISPTCKDPAMNQEAFPNIGVGMWYWTSAESNAAGRLPVVGFDGGSTGNATSNTPLAVRLVRSEK